MADAPQSAANGLPMNALSGLSPTSELDAWPNRLGGSVTASHSSSSGASTITRTSGSVPDAPHQHPAAALELAVLLLDRAPELRPLPRSRQRSATRTFSSRCGRRLKGSVSSSRRPARARSTSSEAAIPSPVGVKSVQTMWPDCSPPRCQSRSRQGLDHVAVADLGLRDLDPRLLHRGHEAVVGHHGHGDSAVELPPPLQVLRDQRDQVVAVVELPRAIDREHPVAVAVVGEADVGAGGS